MSTVIPPPGSYWYGTAPEASAPPDDPFLGYPYPPAGHGGLAIGALVAGIVGLVLTPTLALFLIGGPLGLVMGPTAMVLGWVGRGRAKRGLARGDDLALTGAILGAVTLVLAIAVSGLELWLFTGDWD